MIVKLPFSSNFRAFCYNFWINLSLLWGRFCFTSIPPFIDYATAKFWESTELHSFCFLLLTGNSLLVLSFVDNIIFTDILHSDFMSLHCVFAEIYMFISCSALQGRHWQQDQRGCYCYSGRLAFLNSPVKPLWIVLFISGNFLLQVDSVNKHGILLEVVQVLTDMNLVITKAYISSDGGWFMDGNWMIFVSPRIFKWSSSVVFVSVSHRCQCFSVQCGRSRGEANQGQVSHG